MHPEGAGSVMPEIRKYDRVRFQENIATVHPSAHWQDFGTQLSGRGEFMTGGK